MLSITSEDPSHQYYCSVFFDFSYSDKQYRLNLTCLYVEINIWALQLCMLHLLCYVVAPIVLVLLLKFDYFYIQNFHEKLGFLRITIFISAEKEK